MVCLIYLNKCGSDWEDSIKEFWIRVVCNKICTIHAFEITEFYVKC